MGHSAALTSQLLLVKKLTPYATLPCRTDPADAVCMLYSAYNLVVPSRGKCIVKNDIAIAVPEGTYARIAPSSWPAWRHHLRVGNSVTGPCHRGNVAVVLFDDAAEDFKISRGDQVARLVLERFVIPKVVQVLGLPARPVYSPHRRDGVAPSTHPSSAGPLSMPSSTMPLSALSSTSPSLEPPTSSTTQLSAPSPSFTVPPSPLFSRSTAPSSSVAGPMSPILALQRLHGHPGLNERHDSAFEIREPSHPTQSVLRVFCAQRASWVSPVALAFVLLLGFGLLHSVVVDALCTQ